MHEIARGPALPGGGGGLEIILKQNSLTLRLNHQNRNFSLIMATTIPIHSLTLNTGAKIPAVGIGCWFGKPGSGENKECYDMVANALKVN